MSDTKWLETLSIVLDSINFAIISIGQLILFIKLKYRIDFSGKLTLFILLMVALLRLSNNMIYKYRTIFDMINIVAQALVWASLYYFIFEMALIRSTFKVLTPLQFQKEKSKINLRKQAAMSILLFLLIILDLYSFLLGYQQAWLEENIVFVKTIVSIAKISKFISDVLMFYMFINLFLFFLSKKKETYNI